MYNGEILTHAVEHNAYQKNAASLDRELTWFGKVVEIRIALYFEHENDFISIYDASPPDLKNDDSIFAGIIRENGLGFDERIILILSLIPHIRPQILDTFFIHNKNFNRAFTEFGGLTGKSHGGFLPTGETVAFILAGQELEKRFEITCLFDSDHFFKQKNILKLKHLNENEPLFSGSLIISTEFLNKFTTGIYHKPDYTIHFPAKLIETKLGWNDLVLAPSVFDEIDIITGWVRNASVIMNDWGLERVIKPGYRALFYGPPGTGKTLTATLIGRLAKADVYRIDLSMVVSKYIGETEKNLAGVFDQAENKNWILFFDEADALFGKRTQTSSSNDRFANQEISYLLQRIEDFPGVVILATNLKANIDEAFSRRFQSVVYFPIPDADLRTILWEKVLGSRFTELIDVDISEIAEKYEISGGAIINVVRYAAIKALNNNSHHLTSADLIEGVRKEMIKEGRTL